jgi:hypothetical protein
MRTRSVLLSLALTACPLSAAADSQDFDLSNPFTDFTSWTLFGSAIAINTAGSGYRFSNLHLTAPGVGDQAGSAFTPETITLDFNSAFTFQFHFYISVTAGERGDGMTFVLSANPGLGNAGSGLGYEGLSINSVAFAIDTFHFEGEPVSPSLQILQEGSVTPLAASETSLGDSIRDPNFQWRATVSYTPSGSEDHTGTLVGAIEHPDLGMHSVSSPVDFGQLGLAETAVYYGFTAANGAAIDGHFVTSAAPVPEPHTWLMMAAGLGVLSFSMRSRLIRRAG